MLRKRLLAMAMAISLTSQSFGMMSMAAELKEVPVAMVEDELVVEESTEEFSVKNELEVSTENLEIPTSSSEIHVASFEQEDIVVYEDSVFPDTVFRNYLKKEVGISEEEQLTNKHLEELTVVYMDAQNSTEKIGSLEGIQCCTNLQYLILSGHLFTDASQIENLKNLVTLELYNTELKKMPDLSRLVNLTYINLWENYIPEEEIISSKIPESFLEENPYWIEDTKSYQKEAFGIVVAPVYYANGSEHPFAIKVTGCNRYINYTLSAEINGITTEAHIEDYYSGAMVIPNLRGCEVSEDLQTVTVTLVDEYGKKWIDGESYSVIFAEDVEYPEDAYIGKNDTYAWLNVILSGTVTNTEGMVLQLWNAQGELVGQSESQLDAYKRYVDSRYEDTLGWIDLERNATEIDGNIQLKKLLSAGSYTLKLIDGEDVYEFENTVHVSDKAIIKETALSQYYASLGKYIYLYVSGYEIDSEKVWPVIYDEESGAALSKVTSVKTEFSDSGNIYNYKLEKLDSTDPYWTREYYDIKFESVEGYDYEDLRESELIWVAGGSEVIYTKYNYKKDIFEMGFPGNKMEQGTEVSVSIYPEYTVSYGETAEAEATAVGIADENLRVKVALKDEDGNPYVLENNISKDLRFSYVDKNGEFVDISFSMSIYWDNYADMSGDEFEPSEPAALWDMNYYYSVDTREIPVNVFVPSEKISSGKTVSVYIYSFDGSVSKRVTLKKGTEVEEYDGKEFWKYTGTWKIAEGVLTDGDYRIALFVGEDYLDNYGLYVIDDCKFYQDSQYAEAIGEQIYVAFWSNQLNYHCWETYPDGMSEEDALKFWNENYQLQIFDKFGRELTGWIIDSVRYEGELIVGIQGLPKEYVGFYFKITDKEGRVGVNSEGESYYANLEDGNEVYGQWERTIDNTVYLMSDFENLHAYYGVILSEYDSPVKMTVNPLYNSEPVKSLHIEFSGNREYFFTEEDLSGLDFEEIYQIAIEQKDGKISYYEGYLNVKTEEAGEVTSLKITDEEGKKVNLIEDEYYGNSFAKELYVAVGGTGSYSKQVNVTSSDESVVFAVPGEEEGSYVVTIAGAGTAELTFRSNTNPDVKATVKFKIEQMAVETAVKLSANQFTTDNRYILVAGQSYTVSVDWLDGTAWDNYTFSVPAEYSTVLSTTGKNEIKAISSGYAEVKFTAQNEEGTTIENTILCQVFAEKAKGISTDGSKYVLDPINGIYEANILAYPANESACNDFDVSWTTSPGIFVENKGNGMVRVVAKSNDKANTTITLKAKDGSGKTAKVTVQTGVSVQEIQLVSAVDTLAVGKTTKLKAEVYPVDTTVKTLTWVSDDPMVASVKGGTVTAVSPGTTTIRAIAQDGTQVSADCKVQIVKPAEKVVISGEDVKTIPVIKHEEHAQISLPIEVLGKDGTSDGVSQEVTVKLSGANAKNTDFWYDEETGLWMFEIRKAGKVTVTAATADGGNKKASVVLDCVQHVFNFDIKPPKNTPIYENTWVVKEGTTVKPQVIYNYGEKDFVPVGTEKTYGILIDPQVVDDGRVIVGSGTVKAVKEGEYTIRFTHTDSCDFSVVEQTITLKVIKKNSVDLTDLQVCLPTTLEDTKIAAGSQIQMMAMLNGLKMSGVKAVWTVRSTEENEGTATITTGGKLDLKKSVAGDHYQVVLEAIDKENEENKKSAVLNIEVIKKLAKEEIQLVSMDGTSILTKAYTPQDVAENYKVQVPEGATEKFGVTSNNAKVLQVTEVAEGLWSIKPTGTGTATITVAAIDGSNVKQSLKVLVKAVNVPVKQISTSSKVYTVDCETAFGFEFNVLGDSKTGETATYPVVKWTTSDAKLLSFSKLGADALETDVTEGALVLYPSGKTGKATITGTAMDGSKKSVKLTINLDEYASGKVNERLRLTVPANTPMTEENVPLLTWGKSLQLKTTLIPNGSKNKKVCYEVYSPTEDEIKNVPEGVSVKNGKVTVAKAGNTIIPYTGKVKVVAYMDYFLVNGEERIDICAEQELFIQAPVETVKIKNASTVMKQGELRKLDAEVLFDPYASLTGTVRVLWSVNDTKIAEIDEEGNLHIKENAKVGKNVTVTAAAQDGSGKKATVKIKITAN